MPVSKTEYHYGIYFSLERKLEFEVLKQRLSIVKNMHAPGGFRDFSIALDAEPTVCHIQAQDHGTSQVSFLVGETFELSDEDKTSLDERVRKYSPDYLIALRVNSGEDPGTEHSRAFTTMIRYVLDLYAQLVEQRKLLKDPVLHNKAANWVNPV